MNLTEIVFSLELTMATNSIISGDEADSQISKTSDELDCLQDNIIVDPDSLALLGQLMLLSTQRDFSLISKPGKHKYITRTESFRATLLQVSNAGYHAFLAAHTNMDKIRLACDSAQEHVESINECIIEGEDSDIITMVPVSLRSIHKTAQDFAKWSREIYSKFQNTLKLLEEVHGSCQDTQTNNKNKLKELQRQKNEFENEKEETEKIKQGEQKEMEEIKKYMTKDREAFMKDFQDSEHKVTELQEELIIQEGELEKYKLEQEKANENLKKEIENRGIFKRLINRKMCLQTYPENEKSRIDDKVKNQESELNTKRDRVKADIKKQRKDIDHKEEIWKSNEERRIEEVKKSKEKMEDLSNKISKALIKLNTTNAEKLNIEDIEELLKEGIEKVTELEAHWKQLVIFFEKISNVTQVKMGKAIEDFANVAMRENLRGKVVELEEHWKERVLFSEEISTVTQVEREKAIEDFSNTEESTNLQGKVAERSGNSLKNYTKKKVMQFVFNAYSGCSGISNLSKSYLKISDTYLMPSIIHLGTLLAIDPESEPEKISTMTKEIK